ncbi:hypothetical protein N866_03320 [Actinotalea ferrariae CF5-4]|uniref:GmrSD restriction endonucleases N-terminal domain-containing protein n=1 Tax=Actinotalea ferrariae CF5-4 TaxID=948458 RepID=A0A021VUU5_9CELL|nr:DUF262 domain-containing protein [Actinotalea ferrariae]EYR64883.1 hypothetical protein N866_03320 [Actinotalea ferrariae CF5-4]
MTTLQSSAPLVPQSLDASARSAREVARYVVDGHMTLDAPYQRGSVWSVDQRRNLVRSWMLGLPVPAIIINRRYREAFVHPPAGPRFEFAAVDGKQRLETAVAWFFGDLTVPASWFPAERVRGTVDTDDGPYVAFEGLDVVAQRHTVNRFLVPVAEASADTVADEAVIFGLVNGAGVPQTDADLARAAQIAREGT